MSDPIDTACPHRDDVLARHLDGHVVAEGAPTMRDAAGAAAHDGLAAHLDAHLTGCVSCQQALRRARRLDAALAHETGQFVASQSGADGELLAAERWFAAVAAAAAPAAAVSDESIARPSRGSAARPPFLAWLTGLAVAAGTLAAAAWWRIDEARDRDVVATPHAETPASRSSVGSSPGAGAAADLVRAAETLPAAIAPFPCVSPNDTAPAAVAIDLRRLPKWVQPRADAAAPPRPRSAAARRTEGRQPGARQPDLLALRRQLEDGDVPDAQLVFSAQLANGDLDDALRRHVRRCPQHLDTVVAAVRQGTRRDGAARLLLDLWDDGVCRDRLADDEHAAARLFAGQGAETFRQLQRELAICAQAARRGRCLLALGCARELDVSPSLLAQLEAPRREEALLAAFALSCLPGPCLADVAQRAPTSLLLRAALLRSEAAELADFAAHCGEPAELRQRLRGASLPLFCELASWLRHGADASE